MRRLTPAALALLLLGGCGEAAGTAGAAQTLEVTRGDIAQRVLLTGELDAVNSDALVTPRTPSWSLSIQWMEEDGAAVEAGDKVLEFDSSALGTNLTEQKLRASQAASEMERQEADSAVLFAEKRFQVDRQRLLLEKAQLRAAVPEDSLARREWQERQLELARVTSALESAEESLTTQESAARLAVEVRQIALDKVHRQIDAVSEALEALTLTAPRAGIMLVGEHPWMGRKFDVGDESWPGTTVVRLPDLSVMRVKATLPDVDDGSIEVGMPVVCVLDAWPDRAHLGRIASIGSVASKASRESLRRHFRVWIDLDETDSEHMLPGMSVRVEVISGEVTNVLLAPRAALDIAGSKARLPGGQWADVELGLCDAMDCEVLAGLAEGDRLALERGL